MVLLRLQPQRLLELVLNLILARHKLLNLALHHQGLTLSLLLQLLNLVVLVIGAGFLRDRVICLPCNSQLTK